MHHGLALISMAALVAITFMAAFYLVSVKPTREGGYALAVGTGLVGLGFLFVVVAWMCWNEETHTPLEYRGLIWLFIPPIAAFALVNVVMVLAAIKCQLGLRKDPCQNREFVKKCALATEVALAILGIVWAFGAWLRIPNA